MTEEWAYILIALCIGMVIGFMAHTIKSDIKAIYKKNKNKVNFKGTN